MQTFKLQKIDDSLLQEHSCLDRTDNCYFFGEYAGRKGFGHSDMNQLIFNFKKPMSQKGKKDWPFKQKAIEDIARLLGSTPAWPELVKRTWVPIPPSKLITHSDHDNRIMSVLELLNKKTSPLDIRNILLPITDREPMHASANNKRLTIDDHLKNLRVDESLKTPEPTKIILFDDVITTGATYKASKDRLTKEFPNATFIGIFIARSIVLPNE